MSPCFNLHFISSESERGFSCELSFTFEFLLMCFAFFFLVFLSVVFMVKSFFSLLLFFYKIIFILVFWIFYLIYLLFLLAFCGQSLLNNQLNKYFLRVFHGSHLSNSFVVHFVFLYVAQVWVFFLQVGNIFRNFCRLSFSVG